MRPSTPLHAQVAVRALAELALRRRDAARENGTVQSGPRPPDATREEAEVAPLLPDATREEAEVAPLSPPDAAP